MLESVYERFRGVCTDTVRESFEAGDTIEHAAETARMTTEWWDAPQTYIFPDSP